MQPLSSPKPQIVFRVDFTSNRNKIMYNLFSEKKPIFETYDDLLITGDCVVTLKTEYKETLGRF